MLLFEEVALLEASSLMVSDFDRLQVDSLAIPVDFDLSDLDLRSCTLSESSPLLFTGSVSGKRELLAGSDISTLINGIFNSLMQTILEPLEVLVFSEFEAGLADELNLADVRRTDIFVLFASDWSLSSSSSLD